LIAIRARFAAVAVVAACAIPLIWPGDIPFINDEPNLIASAVQANARGALADVGLIGTFNFAYGPFPVWIYQLLVAISRDLILVAALHTLLIVAVTASALWWISRSLRLWIWFVPLPLLSPYFWFYSRLLWDNPFLIPLGALTIGGYAAHLSSGSRAGLRVSIAAMAAIPLVHLMGLACVLPVAVHMLVARPRSLWRERFAVGAIVLTVFIAGRPYWAYLASHQTPSAAQTSIDGWFFPLFGGRLLSARLLDYFFGSGPIAGMWLAAASSTSWIAYGLVWCGIVVAVWRVGQSVRLNRWEARDHLSIVLLGMLVCQAVVDGFAGKFEHPQYYNATWIAFVMLAWFAADAAVAFGSWLGWTARLATASLALALGVTVAIIAIRLHLSGGTREIYGPTIANQQRVARQLARYAPQTHLASEVSLYERYPHTLIILRGLNARRYYDRAAGDLTLRYASVDPASGWIELVER
jgi:hypothetical protein